MAKRRGMLVFRAQAPTVTVTNDNTCHSASFNKWKEIFTSIRL